MSVIAVEIVIILLLVLCNGVLAMSELAVVSARRVRLQHRADRGEAGARAALELAGDPNQFLSTVQIGITLVGILAGAFGGATLAEQLGVWLGRVAALAPYSEAIGVGVVVLGITYLSLILGELVPKRLALSNAEKVAALVARPMRRLSKIVSPAVRLLSFSTEVVLRLTGIRPASEPVVTEEEIRALIRQGTEAGVFEQAERSMVENIFRLGDRRVHSLMTLRHDIIWLDISDPPEGVRRKLVVSGHSRYLVCRDSLDNVLGVVRAKDLFARNLSGQPISLQAALRQPAFIPETMRAMKALELFKQSGTHLLIVVDEYGSIQGLLTHHDVLEAIVGGIPLAGEPIELPAVRREDGSWLLDGMLPVDEVKDLLGIRKLPGEEAGTYRTLAGFVIMQIGRIPPVGSHFDWQGLRFEVADMDGHRVDKVLVTPAPGVGQSGLSR